MSSTTDVSLDLQFGKRMYLAEPHQKMRIVSTNSRRISIFFHA